MFFLIKEEIESAIESFINLNYKKSYDFCRFCGEGWPILTLAISWCIFYFIKNTPTNCTCSNRTT